MPTKIFFCFLILLTVSIRASDRVAWTTNHIEGSPEKSLPFIEEAIWPHITFSEPVDITFLESEGLMFITERFGKIWTLPSDLNASPSKAEQVMDLTRSVPELNNVLGLAFHPGFRENRQIFVHYSVRVPSELGEVRISRFRLDKSFGIVQGSETVLVKTIGSGHVGGDVQFGPDGMLYFTIGDLAAPSPPDPLNAGQNLGTIAGKICRIDVNHTDRGLPYHIPEDNPFVSLEGARPEIWAYGFRNPWKLSFHPESGEIWTGDVGWEIWEMVHRVKRGGNYGWSVMEGPGALKLDQVKGPTPISPPVAYYSHIEGASITGGYFVTSSRLPELQNTYVYGDYVTGKVWSLHWDGNRATKNRPIADTRKQIVSFGQDSKGDLLFIDFPHEGQLHRLVPNKGDHQENLFPKKLSDTGLFSDVQKAVASPGVYPFSIKAPTWQDGYDSRYWIGLPDDGRIEANIAYRNELPLIRYSKPANTVLAKTIHKEGRRVETQILHWDGYWNGYSFKWNEEQTDASLVPKEGLDTTVMGNPYRFPSRDECVRCHGSNFHRPLAFLPGQIDKDNQLDKFLELGLIDQNFKRAAKNQPLENPYNKEVSLDQRARSWLHSNCSYCHRVSGGSGVTAMMNRGVPNEKMKLIYSLPEKGSLGLADARLIEPGNPYRSILYYRIATKGAGHMPMIGPKTVDQEGVMLVHDWIRSLIPETPIAKASLSPTSVEEALALYHQIQSGELSGDESKQAIANCLDSSDPFVINLFLGFTLE